MRLVIVIISISFFMSNSMEQAQTQNGNIEGELYLFEFLGLKFGSGGVNSIVLLGNGFQAEAKSDVSGRFFFSNVPPGAYSVTVECDVQLKDLGLCRSTGVAKVVVKKGKTAKVRVRVYKM